MSTYHSTFVCLGRRKKKRSSLTVLNNRKYIVTEVSDRKQDVEWSIIV